jgi:hypothetical protein
MLCLRAITRELGVRGTERVKGDEVKRTSYEVRCGRRQISLQRANTAREAIIEYLRSMGVRDDEMSTLGADAISCHGAVYRAVAITRD